jgi:hypothetical protein
VVCKPVRPLAAFSVAVLTAILAGCISQPPTPPYRRVDKNSAAYREAVAREITAQLAQGKSPSAAEDAAERRVEKQFIAAEKARRLDTVAPLTAALTALKEPRGCWAYTVTTRTTRDGQTRTTGERFDPYQPEEKVWTLLTVGGVVPDEAQQAAYRHARQRAWKKQLAREEKRKRSPTEQIHQRALYTNLETETGAEPNIVTYRFVREAAHITLVGDLPRKKETYVIDTATSAMRRHETIYLSPAKMLVGSVTIETFEQATDYGVIDPALPPFPVRASGRFRYRMLSGEPHEEWIEKTYSDYRRVKCYDDRFQVIPGELRAMDVVPDGE